MGMDPELAWRLTPWEFENYSRGWWKSRYHGLITLLRGLTESMKSKDILEQLMGIEKKDDEDDEVMAASEERAYKARIKAMAKEKNG